MSTPISDVDITPIILRQIRNLDLTDVPILLDYLQDHKDPREKEIRPFQCESFPKLYQKILSLFPIWKKDLLMGCDIHCYVEYRKKNARTAYEKIWRDFGGRINPGRYYDFFSVLAGVRSSGKEQLVSTRGVPEDISYGASNDYWLYIVEDEAEYKQTTLQTATRETAKIWHEQGGAYKKDGSGRDWIDNPDWHSASWATPSEWKACLKAVRANKKEMPEYFALLASMQTLEEAGYEVRVVFWFDN